MRTFSQIPDRLVGLLQLFASVLLFAAPISTHAFAQHRALIVAIDKYADTRLSGLPAGLAQNDAASIEKLLVEKLGYKPEEIKVLRNEQATKTAILSAFEKWLGLPNQDENAKNTKLKGLDESGALDNKKRRKRRAKKKRKYVPPPKIYHSYFYFSGFGHFQQDLDGEEEDGRDETLVPYDAKVRPSGGGDQIDGVISDDELAALLWKFSRRHVTLVFDTSHSGIVTRSSILVGRKVPGARVPMINGVVRNFSDGTRMDAHKREAAFVDVKIPRGSLTVWSAVSPTQTALIADEDDRPRGLFTALYADGLFKGEADANGNGIIANAELLRHVREGSTAHCKKFRSRCEMGLRPRLDPPAAYGKVAWLDRKKVTRARERRLTLSRLTDFLGERSEGNIEIRQNPPSPLKVGAGDIRFEMVSSAPGYLVLLNLTEGGELFQLYPNQYSGSDENGFAGPLQANAPLVVPEESYGVKFSATVPAKGHIIAVVTPDPVTFDDSVTDRTIASVSPDEAMPVYLARLSAALNRPINTHSVQANTGTARWSITAQPYEILP